jgi:DNA-directed RNA polymerase subunit RPC12/RpoP
MNEEVACPDCDHRELSVFGVSRTTYAPGKDQVTVMYECASCGFRFRKTDIVSIFEDN